MRRGVFFQPRSRSRFQSIVEYPKVRGQGTRSSKVSYLRVQSVRYEIPYLMILYLLVWEHCTVHTMNEERKKGGRMG